MKSILTSTAIVAALASGSAMADAKWSGSADLGYLATDGNSETQTLTAAGALNRDSEKWKTELTAGASGSRQDDDTTAERYTLGAKQNYKLTGKDYLYGAVNAEKDRFGGYDLRTTETIGYGRQIIKTDATSLTGEIGVGATQYEFTNDTSDSQVIARIAGKFSHKFNAGAIFSQDLTVETGEDNTYGESVTALSMPLAEKINFKVSYTVKHNSAVTGALGKHSDSYTAVTLGYKF